MLLVRCKPLDGGLMAYSREIVSRNLRYLCAQPGFSKAGLARHCKVAAPMVSRWLDEVLPVKYLDEIAEYFRIEVMTLFDPNLVSTAKVPHVKITREQALRVLAEDNGYELRRLNGKSKQSKSAKT